MARTFDSIAFPTPRRYPVLWFIPCCAVALLLAREVMAQEEMPDDGWVTSRLDSQSFDQAISRCLEDQKQAGLEVVVDVEEDGRGYLVEWSPTTLPELVVNCLASEVMQLVFPPSDGSYRFAYAAGSGQATVLHVHPREDWEDSYRHGAKLLFRGLVLTVLGDAMLTVAVALLPRMIVGSWDDGACASDAECGPGDSTWLVFDILGLAAGLVMSFTGAAFMELGFQTRRGAMEASISGVHPPDGASEHGFAVVF